MVNCNSRLKFISTEPDGDSGEFSYDGRYLKSSRKWMRTLAQRSAPWVWKTTSFPLTLWPSLGADNDGSEEVIGYVIHAPEQGIYALF